MSPRALACPASLKSVLSAAVAADALARGFRKAGVAADAMPIADGGRGHGSTCSALASEPCEVRRRVRPAARCTHRLCMPDGTRVVEAAEAIPLDPSRLDVLAASSRGLGTVDRELGAGPLVVTVGGTATMDAGAGLLEVLGELPGPTRVLCDVTTTALRRAAALRAAERARRRSRSPELEARFRGDARLAAVRGAPGSGAAGGLGAALASLGAELVPGADAVLDLLGFDPAAYDLVVTGEGTVDRDDLGGEGAGRSSRGGARRPASAASSSAGACSRARRRRSAATRRGPEQDLVELGERLGQSSFAARRRFAISWSSSQAMSAFSSTSGRNSHEVRPVRGHIGARP